MKSPKFLNVAIVVLMVALSSGSASQERDHGLKSEDPLASMFDPERAAVSDRHCDMPYHIVYFEVDSATLGTDGRNGLESIAVDLSIRLQSVPDSYVIVVGHSTVAELAALSSHRTDVVKRQLLALWETQRQVIDSSRIVERAMGPSCRHVEARAYAVDIYLVPGGVAPDAAIAQVCPTGS